MSDPKQVYRASDAAPVAFYAKRDASSDDIYPVLVNTSGVLLSGAGLGLPSWDYAALVISPATTETYTFKSGGASGTTVATVVIVYTDSTRTDISTVTKT